jgi:signal transduction histidine kinase
MENLSQSNQRLLYENHLLTQKIHQLEQSKAKRAAELIIANDEIAAIKTKASTKNHMIKGAPGQLYQVVMNLIINASEAIGKEQGEVNISLCEIQVIAGKAYEDFLGDPFPYGEYVCIEVTDNGCGTDEITKSRLFEPFYTTKFTGRGLGMSSVLGIIKSHACFY